MANLEKCKESHGQHQASLKPDVKQNMKELAKLDQAKEGSISIDDLLPTLVRESSKSTSVGTSDLHQRAASELKRGNMIAIKGRACTIIDIKRNHLHTKYNITGVDSGMRKVNDVFTSSHTFQLLVPPPTK